MALAACLAGDPAGGGRAAILWLAGAALALAVPLVQAEARRSLFRGRLGWPVALAAGLAWGGAWAWLNFGPSPPALVLLGLLFGALALGGRALAATVLIRQGQAPATALAKASLAAGLGLLVLPAFFLPGPSRHLASLVLAVCLSSGLVMLMGPRRLGQAALVVLSLSAMLYLVELAGTAVLARRAAVAKAAVEPTASVPAPGANEAAWRTAKRERARAEQNAHWFERCYQGQALSINSYGFRGREFSAEKPPDVFRVFVTGASVGFGTVTSADELTLAGQLERRLGDLSAAAGAGLKAEVYNLALPALTSAGEVGVLLNLMEARPDLVIMFTGWNDLVFAHEPGYFAEGQLGLLVPGCQTGDGGRGVRGEVDQTTFGARHTATIGRAARQLLLLVHERAADSSRGYHWLTSLGEKVQPATDRPAAEKKIGPEAESGLGRSGSGDIGVDRLLANVRRAKALAGSQGAGLLLAVQPFRHSGPVERQKPQGARMRAIRDSYLALLDRLAAEDGLDWVDTTPAGDLMESMGSFYDSCHFDDEGYALAAEEVFAALLRKGLVPPLAGIGWTFLEPGPGRAGLRPSALTIGQRAEATFEAATGREMVFRLPEKAGPGRAVLWTGLGLQPWVEVDKKLEIPYEIILRRAGGEVSLAAGTAAVEPPRSEAWLPLRIDLPALGSSAAEVVLRAGQPGGPFENLHWRRPVLVTLSGRD